MNTEMNCWLNIAMEEEKAGGRNNAKPLAVSFSKHAKSKSPRNFRIQTLKCLFRKYTSALLSLLENY
jgi:hypothetical protein